MACFTAPSFPIFVHGGAAPETQTSLESDALEVVVYRKMLTKVILNHMEDGNCRSFFFKDGLYRLLTCLLVPNF